MSKIFTKLVNNRVSMYSVSTNSVNNNASNKGKKVDKFFIVLTALVLTVLVFSANSFKQHSSASTLEAAKVIMSESQFNNRSPAIINKGE